MLSKEELENTKRIYSNVPSKIVKMDIDLLCNSHLELYAELEQVQIELAEYHKLAICLDEQGEEAVGVIKTLEGINQKLYDELAEAKPFMDAVKSMHNGYNPECQELGIVEPKNPTAAIKQLIGEAESMALTEAKELRAELAELRSKRDWYWECKAFHDWHVYPKESGETSLDVWKKYYLPIWLNGNELTEQGLNAIGELFRNFEQAEAALREG
jgi:hypothetical protein